MAEKDRELFNEEEALNFIVAKLAESDEKIAEARASLSLKGFPAWLIAYLSSIPDGLIPGDEIPHYVPLAEALGYAYPLAAWQGMNALEQNELIVRRQIGRHTPLITLQKSAEPYEVLDLEEEFNVLPRNPYPETVGDVPPDVTHRRAVQARRENPEPLARAEVLRLIAKGLENPVLPANSPHVPAGSSPFMLLHLSELMRRNVLTPGTPLPSMAALENLYPRSTQKGRRLAFSQLASLGLLDPQRGRGGTIVAATPTAEQLTLLVETAAKFYPESKRAPRQAPNIVRSPEEKFAAWQNYLDSHPDSLRAARLSIEQSAGFFAEALQEISESGMQFPPHIWLMGVLDQSRGFVERMSGALQNAGWVRVDENIARVNTAASRLGSIEELRSGMFTPPAISRAAIRSEPSSVLPRFSTTPRH